MVERPDQKDLQEQDYGVTDLAIGFSKSRIRFPIIGQLIVWFQKGRYSHTYIKFYSKRYAMWIVIDATGHGVRVGGEEEFLKRNRPVKQYKLKATDETAERLMHWALEKARMEYSKLEILGNLIQLMFCLKKNPFRQGLEYTRCNELVALAVEEILGLEIHENLDDIDLVWLDEFLEKNLAKP